MVFERLQLHAPKPEPIRRSLRLLPSNSQKDYSSFGNGDTDTDDDYYHDSSDTEGEEDIHLVRSKCVHWQTRGAYPRWRFDEDLDIIRKLAPGCISDDKYGRLNTQDFEGHRLLGKIRKGLSLLQACELPLHEGPSGDLTPTTKDLQSLLPGQAPTVKAIYASLSRLASFSPQTEVLSPRLWDRWRLKQGRKNDPEGDLCLIRSIFRRPNLTDPTKVAEPTSFWHRQLPYHVITFECCESAPEENRSIIVIIWTVDLELMKVDCLLWGAGCGSHCLDERLNNAARRVVRFQRKLFDKCTPQQAWWDTRRRFELRLRRCIENRTHHRWPEAGAVALDIGIRVITGAIFELLNHNKLDVRPAESVHYLDDLKKDLVRREKIVDKFRVYIPPGSRTVNLHDARSIAADQLLQVIADMTTEPSLGRVGKIATYRSRWHSDQIHDFARTKEHDDDEGSEDDGIYDIDEEGGYDGDDNQAPLGLEEIALSAVEAELGESTDGNTDSSGLLREKSLSESSLKKLLGKWRKDMSYAKIQERRDELGDTCLDSHTITADDELVILAARGREINVPEKGEYLVVRKIRALRSHLT